MIKNWNYQKLNMDFQGLQRLGITCSDIDLFHITHNGFLIIGEIKNEQGTFTNNQKRLFEQIVDSHSGGGTIIFITHDKYAQYGDKSVDISECPVKQYYWNGEWIVPGRLVTVEQFMRKMEYG